MTKYVIKLAKNLNFCANWLVLKHRKVWSKLLELLTETRVLVQILDLILISTESFGSM